MTKQVLLSKTEEQDTSPNQLSRLKRSNSVWNSTWIGTITDIYSEPGFDQVGLIIIRLHNGYITSAPSLWKLKIGDEVIVLNISFQHPDDPASRKGNGTNMTIILPR